MRYYPNSPHISKKEPNKATRNAQFPIFKNSNLTFVIHNYQ